MPTSTAGGSGGESSCSSADGDGAGGGMFGSAPRDFVSATAGVTSQLQSSLERARWDPAGEIGITVAELKERRKLALSPRTFVSDKTQRGFDVKSSARAQQIMNEGLFSRQREMRKKEVLKKMRFLRYVQVGTCVLGAGFLGWFSTTFLLPRYAAVRERSRLLQLRCDMARRKWEELRPQEKIGEDLGN